MSKSNQGVADDIKSLILSIEVVAEEVEKGVIEFRKEYKGKCNQARDWQGKGLSVPNYLKILCDQGLTYWKNKVLNPLLIYLLNYRDLLLEEGALTGDYQTFIKGLITNIHRYAVIVSFFGKNPFYIIPGMTIENVRYQKQFREIILKHVRKLMGCNSEDKFKIKEIASKVKVGEEHMNMLKYIDYQCVLLSNSLLK